MNEYRVRDKRFENAAEAIDFAFKICAEENVNAIEIIKVRLVEPRGFMNAIDHEIMETMVIKGPANYKIDALNSNF